MRLAWLTDIHLNFLTDARRAEFARDVERTGADLVLISGDIAEAPTIADSLATLTKTGAAVLYVLGNHDFYKGDIETVRRRCRSLDFGHYLHDAPPIAVSDELAIVGVDGWADGQFGAPRQSELIFTDWHLIEDFRAVNAVFDMDRRLELLRQQGEESARALRRSLNQAVERFSRILILTHVPPFRRLAGDDGSHQAALWVPWLTCKATGDVIAEFASRHPQIQFEVLCGHTHVPRKTREAPNLIAEVGKAEYRRPVVQRTWEN